MCVRFLRRFIRAFFGGEYLVIKCVFFKSWIHILFIIHFIFFKGEEVASLKISIPVADTNGLLMPHMFLFVECILLLLHTTTGRVFYVYCI